jgi:sugar phosphate permease
VNAGDPIVNEQRGLHLAWVILGICFVNLVVNYAVRLGFGVVLPEMIRTLGFSRVDGGSIYNAYLLTYIVVTPLTGYLTDRLGARRVISVCLVLLGSGVTLLGTAEHLWSACLFFGLTGLGASGLWVPIITVVQRWFSYRRKGLALGILSTGYGLGFALMGAAFPWVVGHYSWRHAWTILGILALGIAAPNALVLRSDPADCGLRPWGQRETPRPSPAKTTAKVPLSAILREANFWMIGASYFCISYGLYGFTTFMVDYATYQLGLPLAQAGLLASIHGFCQILGVLTVLPFSDYAGRKRTILLSNAIITGLLIGLWLLGGSWASLCVITGAVAVFYAATFPIYGACAGDYFPKEAMGTVAGAWTPFYGSGAILTHWVTGRLRDVTGVYDHAFIVCAAMAGVSVVLMGLVKPMHPRQPEIASSPDVH